MKFLIALLGLMLAGCTAPLKPVSFDQPVAATSDLAATVVLISGAVRGSSGTALVPAGTVFVPLSTGPTPQLQFNPADQRVFVESFRAELQRLKLVREALPVSAGGSSELGIQLIFAQTFHNPDGHLYMLDVVMEIAGGKRSFLKQYRVVSNEGDNWLQRMNANAQEGKAKAGKKLMQQLIPDVAAYIAENRKPTGQSL